MNSTKLKKDGFIFSTTTSSSSSADEFLVELFDYSPDQCCDGTPAKIIRNFDDLIDFIEQIDWDQHGDK